tara:strand:+ start:481 stop:582 length:102 start_codon:yes stop_codon:yes gene_type:complete
MLNIRDIENKNKKEIKIFLFFLKRKYTHMGRSK